MSGVSICIISSLSGPSLPLSLPPPLSPLLPLPFILWESFLYSRQRNTIFNMFVCTYFCMYAVIKQ